MKTALTLFVALLGAAVLAQFDMTNLGRMQARPCMAMGRSDIRKELKLTKEQNSEVDKIEKDFNGNSRNAGNDFSSIGASMDKMREADEKIAALLDDKQKKRLTEIRIQMQGEPAVADPEFSSQVGLTDDQIAKVNELQKTYIDGLMAMMHHPDRSLSDKAEKMRTERDAKIDQVLTDAERIKFKEMQGAPFKNARQKGSIF